MRRVLLAGGTVICIGLGFMPQADAFPAATEVQGYNAPAAIVVQYADRHGDRRPGYWRRHYYRRALRHYRGHPGAQYELRQNRRIFCRNTPERC